MPNPLSCANQSCPRTIRHLHNKTPLCTLKLKGVKLKLCALCCDVTRKFLPKKDLSSLKEDVKDFRTRYDGLLSILNLEPTFETENFGESDSESQESPSEEVPRVRLKRKKNQIPANRQDNHTSRGPSPPPEVWLDEEQTPPRKRNRVRVFQTFWTRKRICSRILPPLQGIASHGLATETHPLANNQAMIKEDLRMRDCRLEIPDGMTFLSLPVVFWFSRTPLAPRMRHCGPEKHVLSFAHYWKKLCI